MLSQMNATTKSNALPRARRGNMAEFPLVLFVIFILTIIPLLDLLTLAAGACTVFFVARNNATAAATQSTFNQALTALKVQANILNSSGLVQFTAMKPVAGYQSCGTDLYIDTVNWHQNTEKTYGPNSPLPPPIDQSTNIYSIEAKACYDVGPFVSLHSVPYLSSVPGLGIPARISFTANRSAEFPDGLADSSAKDTNQVTLVTLPNGDMPITAAPAVDALSWNNPNVYNQIAGTGETIVAQTVITVYGNGNGFTPTNINVNPGENLWIDTHAAGAWGVTNMGNSGFTSVGAQGVGSAGKSVFQDQSLWLKTTDESLQWLPADRLYGRHATTIRTRAGI